MEIVVERLPLYRKRSLSITRFCSSLRFPMAEHPGANLDRVLYEELFTTTAALIGWPLASQDRRFDGLLGSAARILVTLASVGSGSEGSRLGSP